MKKSILLISVFFIFLNPIFSQSDSLEFIEYLGGIKHNDEYFYDLKGMEIFVKSYDKEYSKYSINMIRKDLKLKRKSDRYPLHDMHYRTTVLRNQKIGLDTVTGYISCYIVEKFKNKLLSFVFTSYDWQDTIQEINFVNAFMNLSIPDSIYSNMEVDTINFAGRKIKVGNICRWMGVRNLQCPDYGQMNWSYHSNLKEAETALNIQKATSFNQGMTKVKDETIIPVVFENQEIMAERVEYKVQLPKLVMGGSNKLIAYYVIAEIRGYYIRCVLSHFTDDYMKEGELPPLLNEVMKLKNNDILEE